MDIFSYSEFLSHLWFKYTAQKSFLLVYGSIISGQHLEASKTCPFSFEKTATIFLKARLKYWRSKNLSQKTNH